MLSAALTSRSGRLTQLYQVSGVRNAMGVAMLLLATVMFMRWAGIGPFGELGTATGLRGIKLIIAIVVNFILGGLMSIGVGLYAPCMALCVILGLDTGCAFPAMMGSCAYLMAFGNSPKFIHEDRLLQPLLLRIKLQVDVIGQGTDSRRVNSCLILRTLRLRPGDTAS